MSQPRQLTEEEKRRFQEYLNQKKKDGSINNNGLSTDSNILAFLVDDIINKLRQKDMGKALMYETFGPEFKNGVSRVIITNAIDALSNVSDLKDHVIWQALDEQQTASGMITVLYFVSTADPYFAGLFAQALFVSYLNECDVNKIVPDTYIFSFLMSK